jgi:nucleoside 2-deoxyribosyltransferase
MRRIYFAHAMTNCDSAAPVGALVTWLKQSKWRVTHPTYVLFTEELARATLEAIRAADVVIADVSTYSHGVGFELGFAYALGKKTIVVAHEAPGVRVSEFIRGLYPTMVCYRDEAELIACVAERLGKAEREADPDREEERVYVGTAAKSNQES